jgi:hypothetical protein
MALDTRAARATLVRGSALLGPGLGLVTTGAQPRPGIALAIDDVTARAATIAE